MQQQFGGRHPTGDAEERVAGGDAWLNPLSEAIRVDAAEK